MNQTIREQAVAVMKKMATPPWKKWVSFNFHMRQAFVWSIVFNLWFMATYEPLMFLSDISTIGVVNGVIKMFWLFAALITWELGGIGAIGFTLCGFYFIGVILYFTVQKAFKKPKAIENNPVK